MRLFTFHKIVVTRVFPYKHKTDTLRSVLDFSVFNVAQNKEVLLEPSYCNSCISGQTPERGERKTNKMQVQSFIDEQIRSKMDAIYITLNNKTGHTQ
jgi:hypothetical protein